LRDPAAVLRRNDGDDFHGPRIDDHNLVSNEEIFEAAPPRLDFDERLRHPNEVHGSWHAGTDVKREVDTVDPGRVALPYNDVVNARALLLWQLDVHIGFRTSALAAFNRGAPSLAATLSRATFVPLALNVFAPLVAVRLLGLAALTGRLPGRSLAFAATNIPLILPGCAFAGVLSTSLARLTGLVALLFVTLCLASCLAAILLRCLRAGLVLASALLATALLPDLALLTALASLQIAVLLRAPGGLAALRGRRVAAMLALLLLGDGRARSGDKGGRRHRQ
jgi:hypothetical protein